MCFAISYFKSEKTKKMIFFKRRPKVFERLTEIKSMSRNATFVLSMLYSYFFMHIIPVIFIDCQGKEIMVDS